ncbi:MAG: hypothetical protein ABUL72_06540, partial [Armatimonadota bacterium]
RSTDGGATDAPYIYTGISDSGHGDAPTANFIAPSELSDNDPNIMWAGGFNGWLSTNVKAATPTWTQQFNGRTAAGNISAIGIDPQDDGHVFLGTNAGCLFMDHFATGSSPTWFILDNNSIANPLPDRTINRIVVDPHTSSTLYVGLGGFSAGNLLKSTNDGASFTSISGSGVTALPSAPVRAIAVNPADSSNIFVGTEVGIFETDDGGANWSASNFGPANVATYDLRWMKGSAKRLIAATFGRGVWVYSLPVHIVSVGAVLDEVGGNNHVLTFYLDSPAPPGGAVVPLSSSNPSLMNLPASITYPEGTTAKAFSFTPAGVDADTVATIQVNGAVGGGAFVNFTVHPASVSSFTFSPNSVTGGTNTSGVVNLNGFAGPSGRVVNLMNGSSKVVLPSSVTVASQTKTKAFTVVTGGVSSTTVTTNTATSGNSVQGTLTLNPATMFSLAFNQSSIVGGNNVVLTARLAGTAPAGGTIVHLSGPASLHLPATLLVPAGKVAGAVSFNPDGVDSGTTLTIQADTIGSDIKTTPITLTPASFVSIGYSPSVIRGGQHGAGVIRLNGFTGPSGMTVNLSSNSFRVTVPATVTLGPNQRAASFSSNSVAVTSNAVTTTQGVANGVTLNAGLTLTP